MDALETQRQWGDRRHHAPTLWTSSGCQGEFRSNCHAHSAVRRRLGVSATVGLVAPPGAARAAARGSIRRPAARSCLRPGPLGASAAAAATSASRSAGRAIFAGEAAPLQAGADRNRGSTRVLNRKCVITNTNRHHGQGRSRRFQEEGSVQVGQGRPHLPGRAHRSGAPRHAPRQTLWPSSARCNTDIHIPISTQDKGRRHALA